MAVKKAAVIMGSESDLPVVEKAMRQLEELGIPYEAAAFAENAAENGFGVIIAAAGKAAHLAGAMAAGTTLPVIGIPLKSSALDGLDALLSTVQMPSGMPVATVAIDGAQNAAILAAQILALSDVELALRVAQLRQKASDAVREKDAQLQKRG